MKNKQKNDPLPLFISLGLVIYFLNGILAIVNYPGCGLWFFSPLFQPIYLALLWSGLLILILIGLYLWGYSSIILQWFATTIIAAFCTLTPDVGTPNFAIENHFLWFCAAVFIAQALNLRLLWYFTLLVGIGHALMGYFAPLCIYGITKALWTRALIHAVYVGLEVLGLWWFIIRRKHELQELQNSKTHDLQNAQQQIDSLNKDEIIKSLRQFVYIASHDLQTPIRAISGFAELLENKVKIWFPETLNYLQLINDNKETTEKLKSKIQTWTLEALEYLEFIKKGGNTLYSMINGLLDYSRALSAAIKIEQVDVNNLIQNIISLFPVELQSHIHVENLPMFLNTDGTRLHRILTNAISNGLKFVNKGTVPDVTVSAIREPPCWHFKIIDKGIGISTNDLLKIGEPFVRLQSKDEFPGTGIGIASMKIAVERLQGKIWIESAGLNQGTTVHILFPDIPV